jgi:hypothetical protein
MTQLALNDLEHETACFWDRFQASLSLNYTQTPVAGTKQHVAADGWGPYKYLSYLGQETIFSYPTSKPGPRA